MINFSEFDLRQLNLMLQSIFSYERNTIRLSSLIGTLDFLLNILEVNNEEWKEKISEEITNLEIINAIEINNENGEEFHYMDPLDKKEKIEKAIYNLKSIINNKLNA